MVNTEATIPATDAEDSTLSAITISARVPDFWTDQARLWFAQFEAVVINQRLPDIARYNLVVAKLNKEAIQQISDILLTPPVNDKYNTLKTRLLTVYEESETRQLQKLLSEVELGDQRPSQLLRRMRDLARMKIPEDTLRVMWTGHLPTAVRAVLAVSDTKDLDNLAAVADKIIENTRPLVDVNEVTSSMNHAPSASHKSETDINRIVDEISKLSMVVKRMGRTQPSWHETHRQRSRSRTPSRSRSGSRLALLLSPAVPRQSTEVHPTVQLDTENGKLSEVQSATGDCTSLQLNHRLCVIDRESRLHFLVDTGANISVLPKCSVKIKTTNLSVDYKLYAANGTEIKTYGLKTLVVDLGLRRSFRWTFVIADVKQPIIGADFLSHFKLLVDLSNRRIVDQVTKLKTIAGIVKTAQPSASTLDKTIPCLDLLSEFPNITKPISFKETPSHSVVHHIETTGPPVFKSKTSATGPLSGVKEEFQTMMDMGICKPSKSPWASPLHVVPKRRADPCGDYRRLNAVTKPDRYPIPRLQDFTYILTGKKIFSRIDINRAYHHIPIHENDIEKTAIITPFGLFDFSRMTFGLRNAAQTFQRFLNHTVLQGLDFLFAYIDDIIIASDDIEQHRRHLKALFSRLDTYGITINLSKCAFEKDKIDFLGYEVSTSGISPLEERSHLPKAAEYQAILNKHIHGAKKKDKTPIDWTPDDERAFEKCKVSLQSAVTLSHPLADATLGLMTDASNTAVGNAVADALSRVDAITCPTTINFEELSAAQSDDATLTHLLQDTDSSAKLKRIFYLPVKLPLPLPTTTDDYKYLLTIIDRCTGWPEAFPMKDISADSVAKVILEGWIARYGCPSKLTSDQGKQFESNLFIN
ncbi:Retrovirus-related Pol polyprotein from transposon 297 [Eumeta japonica]|uniref:Retrovirus-related Pol polyprotein from transposon 297 n=1 Tax=Eumeta variegata TaxID=151549 RepID=A0A4C1WS67_EUMVA|nr:Retrovirus-related Pol polyprotein from transposon 297 [Eumeta japonica]